MTIKSPYHATKKQLNNEVVDVENAKLDPNAFEVLYNRYYEQIFRYVYQRLNCKDEASDITSQVFLKALSNINKYNNKGVPFVSWLYRIASNEMHNLFRKNKKVRTVNIDSENISFMMEEIDDESQAENHQKLINIIKQLPEDDLQIIELRYFEKRPFKEVCEILNITENNAKVKVYRLLKKLKKELSKKGVKL